MRRRQTLAALCAATLEHQPAILRGHTGAKTMRLGSTTIVRLKCSLRHSQLFSTQVKSVRLTACADYVKKTRPKLHLKCKPTLAADKDDIKHRIYCGEGKRKVKECSKTILFLQNAEAAIL
jgi:hypothetical protein